MAQLKDLIVNGASRFIGDIFGNLTGNADTATKWASAQKVYVTLGTASTTTTLQGGSSSAQTIGVNGTLNVANGGTGTTTFTSGALLIGNGTGAIGTRTITNNTTSTPITNNNTKIPTMNTIYYGLATVNNASQSRATGIYAPTSAGTAGQILTSAGGTSAPTWYGGWVNTGTEEASWTASFKGTTASTSTDTGAVTIDGGLGVAGQITAARIGAGGSNTSFTFYSGGNSRISGSLAEGFNTTASGNASHAEGESTTASGLRAHAEGYDTTASGPQAHAEGVSTTASAPYSHAEGYYTTAQKKSQHVFGEYNILDTQGPPTGRGAYVEIVGNGTSTARSNARTLDWSGNEWLAGTLTTSKFIHPAITGSGTAASPQRPALWRFNLGIATPTEGDIITIKIPVAGHGNGVFVSTDNGTTYYPVSVSDTTRLGTHFGANQVISLVFLTSGGTNAVYPVAGGAATDITGNHWCVLNYYDSGNTDTVMRTYAHNTNQEFPLLAGSTTTNTTPLSHISSYASTYGAIVATAANRPTINLSTGAITVPGGMRATNQASSWLTGQNLENAAYNMQDINDISNYWPWMRQSNIHSSVNRNFSMGLHQNSFFWMGSTTSRTENERDMYLEFNISPGYLKLANNQDQACYMQIESKSGQWSFVRLYNQNSHYWDIATVNAANGTASANALQFRYNSANPTSSSGVWISSAGVLMGAAWNDYAEYRKTKKEIQPGYCVKENGDDTLELTSKRLERGCEIVSDTFGFAIGQTEECKTPIASSGRVLAYTYEDREEFKKHIGWPVCSGPNGTVSIMTEEEEEKYPSRIIGTISAVPDYETWNDGNIKVNGRVWIRVR